MEIPLLKNILILFGLAIAVLLICNKLDVSSIVGFLLTIIVTYLISMHLGLKFEQSIFIGFLVSLSSTAIVLKVIQERSEIESPHGRILLGILIFQDVIIVPMILITPLLTGATENLGESIYYGDATHEAVLKHANIKDARIVVIAINDPTATRRITEIVRRLNPKVHLVVRTRYLQEMKPLYKLGADEVIPEEFETSEEIFTRVLAKYLIPRDKIEKFVTEVRSGGYEMFRSISNNLASFSDLKLQLPDFEISVLRLDIS